MYDVPDDGTFKIVWAWENRPTLYLGFLCIIATSVTIYTSSRIMSSLNTYRQFYEGKNNKGWSLIILLHIIYTVVLFLNLIFSLII